MVSKADELDEGTWKKLAAAAWACRENAVVLGNTKVGAAVLSEGRIFAGCNIEHKFRSHDVHAEVNAIGSMVAGGKRRLQAIMIAAERERFTPCGACMDWIFEFGGEECLVAYQTKKDGEVVVLKAHELMPYYPS